MCRRRRNMQLLPWPSSDHVSAAGCVFWLTSYARQTTSVAVNRSAVVTSRLQCTQVQYLPCALGVSVISSLHGRLNVSPGGVEVKGAARRGRGDEAVEVHCTAARLHEWQAGRSMR